MSLKNTVNLERFSAFDTLRSYYHSLNEAERKEAIECLGEMNDPDAARELMQVFKECHWRTTQLEIIRVLSKCPTQRSLEFLFRIARNDKDLPFADAAIRSLGQSHHTLAARFLVSFYRHAPETLKPAIAAALGEIPDRTLIPELLKDLPRAIRSHQILFARNLALSLGELKARESLSFLEEIVVANENQELVLSALISIGKIARSPFMLNGWEHRFRGNLLEYQIFSSVRTQVHCRSQWKLEDYLRRLFESPEVHPVLPYELHHFNPTDVFEGLRLYNVQAYFKRMCLVLSRVDFPEMEKWYAEFFKLDSLNVEQTGMALESISAHFTQSMLPVIQTFRSAALKDRDSSLFKKWLDAVSLSLPEAHVLFSGLIGSAEYREFTDSQRVSVLNALTNFGLCVQGDPKSLSAVGAILEEVLFSDSSTHVQGRTIRALGALNISTKKIANWVHSSILNPLLTSSCLYFLEMNSDERERAEIFESLLGDRELRRLHAAALLRALKPSRAVSIPFQHKGFDTFLRNALSEEAPLEERLAALGFLASHPREGFLEAVIACLQSDPRLRIAAMIALKNLKSERAADFLAPYLNSEDRSHSGRALDALTGLPGLRPRRILIDYLEEKAESLDVCDKLIRSLEPLETQVEYFSSVLDSILHRFPNHPRLEGLLGLKERFFASKIVSNGEPASSEITRVDGELSQKCKAYANYDASVKAALRSAELTFLHPEVFGEGVDKSSSVLGYCKATDLVLERVVGRKKLKPALEQNLHGFQNALYGLALNEESVTPERALLALELNQYFTPESLPLHKMLAVSAGILNGRILDENFKILDGLRSWAVLMLIFCREIHGKKALLPVPKPFQDSVIRLAKRLLQLQEIRNGAAHRKTLLQIVAVDEVRKEVFWILNQIEEVFNCP